MPGATRRGDRPHARIYSEWKTLPAWRALSPLMIAILVDALMDFDIRSGPACRLTARGVAARYGVGHRTARRAIKMLSECGWLEWIGPSPGPTGQSGGLYRITCLTDRGKPCAGSYESWREPNDDPKPNVE